MSHEQNDNIPERDHGITPLPKPDEGDLRRNFLSKSSSAVMALGLVGGYGCFGTMMGQFLFPSHGTEKIWQFVRDLAGFRSGESMTYISPAGERVVISRTGDAGTEADFVALSSVCPHLGCQVHWELQNNRFFCPCHNGAFDPEGNATQGPPFDAGQALLKFPLKIERGMLFIEVASERLLPSDDRDAS